MPIKNKSKAPFDAISIQIARKGQILTQNSSKIAFNFILWLYLPSMCYVLLCSVTCRAITSIVCAILNI